MLVATPQPYPDESSSGYLVRLTEANGYPSVMYLRHLLERKSCGQSVSASDLVQLAGVEADLAERIALHDRIGLASQNEDGLPPKEVAVVHAAVCPRCLDETGYCDGFWDLAQAWVCPIHREWLVRSCNSCGKNISNLRARVAHCACGTRFRQSRGSRAPGEIVEVMGMLRAAFHRSADSKSASPGGLDSLTAAQFVRLIRRLRRYFNRADRSRYSGASRDVGKQMALIVCRALLNWPAGFQACLSKLYEEEVSSNTVSLPIRDFDLIVRLVQSVPSGALDFVAAQAALFAARFLPHNRLSSLYPYLPKGTPDIWISMADAADLLKVNARTLRKSVDGGAMEWRTIGTSPESKDSIVISRQWVDALKQSAYSPIGLRAAGRHTGLPVETLKWLRKNNVLHNKYMTLKPLVIAIEDLDDLMFRIAELGKSLPPSCDVGALTIGTIRSHYQFGGVLLGRLLDSLLKDPRSVLGRIGPALSDIQISEEHELAFAPGVRRDHQKWIPQDRAAEILGCSTPGIQTLLDAGYIKRRRAMARGTVCTTSLGEFSESYTLLAKVSKELGTYSRTLTTLARRSGVPLKNVEGGMVVTLVPTKEVQSIRKLYLSSLT